MVHIVFIFNFCFAGFLPVVSCVLVHNSLIINTIHFSGMQAFSGGILWRDAAHCGGVCGGVDDVVCWRFEKCATDIMIVWFRELWIIDCVLLMPQKVRQYGGGSD